VQLPKSGGKSFQDVGQDLGVWPDALRVWVQSAEIDAEPSDDLTTGERRELRQPAPGEPGAP
jgi:hypothetical protein